MIARIIAQETRRLEEAMARGELAAMLPTLYRDACVLRHGDRPLAVEDAEALRMALLAFVREVALPALATPFPGVALDLLDAMRPYLVGAVADLRAALEAAQRAQFPPPAPLPGTELARLATLAEELRLSCTLGEPTPHAEWAARLAARGYPLPDELIALLAAHDGLTLCDPGADIGDHEDPPPLLSLLPGAMIEVVPSRGVRIGHDDRGIIYVHHGSDGWWTARDADSLPVRFELRTWLASAIARLEAFVAARDESRGNEVSGAPRRGPTHGAAGTRVSDFEALLAAGDLSAARALCDAQLVKWRDEVESCQRAGEGGEATRAERQVEAWEERARLAQGRGL